MPLSNPSRAARSHVMANWLNLRQGIANSQSATNLGPPSAGAWPTANLAIFTPVTLERPEIIERLWWFNGGVSGNVDCGVYDADYRLLVSTGAVAQSGANVLQSVDITDYAISPGRYWVALSLSGTSGSIVRSGYQIGFTRASGVFQMSSAHPLPSTAVPEAAVNNYIPICGMAFRSLV